MNIRELVERLVEEAAFLEVMNNPLSQFGSEAEPLLGAELMPERNVDENAWVEEGIRYRSIIANDGTRYSPVQLKEGVMTGSFQVILGNSDIGSHFTGQHYDALIRILKRFGTGQRPAFEQMPALIGWVETTLNMPLRMKNELQRWQAIVNAQILRSGDGGYREVVNIPNPAGHRVNAGGTWSDDTYDPWPDIVSMMNFLQSKGFIVKRIVGSTRVRTILLNNLKVRQRAGVVTIIAGTVAGLAGAIDVTKLNDMLGRDNIPALEIYDGQYRTSASSGYYMPRDVLVFFCATGRNESVLPIDQQEIILSDTIGYVGIGRPAGASGPGRSLSMHAFDNKPPRVEGESWQTSGPVIYEPEGFGVIKVIN